MTKVFTSKQLADYFVTDQQDRHKDPDKYRGYRFPMPWFMKHTGGWGKGFICFVFGKGGIGKTSVLSTAATQLGKDGVNFLYISLEETLDVVCQRIFTNLEDIDRTLFRDVKLTATDWPNVYSAGAQMGKFSGHWVHGLYEEAPIIDAVQRFLPDVILVDYLQLMIMPGKSMTEQVSYGTKLIARIAKGHYTPGHKITTITAVQLNDDEQPLYSRDPDRDGDLNVKITGLDNGSGGILPDSRLMTITKARHGGPGSKRIAFFGGRSMVGEHASANRGPLPKP